MNTRKFTWSTDGGFFVREEFDTWHEALAAGFAGSVSEIVYVGEIESPTMPEEFIDVDVILQSAGEHRDYECEAAEGWDRSTKEQRAELTDALRETMREWRESHNLTPAFDKVSRIKAYHRNQQQP